MCGVCKEAVRQDLAHHSHDLALARQTFPESSILEHVRKHAHVDVLRVPNIERARHVPLL
jgi:hypothetical protein